MTLDPRARAAVELAAGEPPVWELDLDETRAADRAAALSLPREHVADVRDVDADSVPCRLYRPAGSPPDALIVHLHGGGFVLNDVEVHDAVCRELANAAGVAVLSVEYRLAPEHPFPAARDDVDTVIAWLDREGLGAPGLAGARLVAHGDSAGGNLALVAALRHPGRFAATVLIYPFLDPELSFPSHSTEPGWGAAEARWFWDQYAATPADLADPDLAPLRSDRLGSLPPTLVATAEHDIVRDEGEELARRLAEVGVEVTATRYLGQIHAFWRQSGTFPASRVLIGQVAGFVREHALRD